MVAGEGAFPGESVPGGWEGDSSFRECGLETGTVRVEADCGDDQRGGRELAKGWEILLEPPERVGGVRGPEENENDLAAVLVDREPPVGEGWEGKWNGASQKVELTEIVVDAGFEIGVAGGTEGRFEEFALGGRVRVEKGGDFRQQAGTAWIGWIACDKVARGIDERVASRIRSVLGFEKKKRDPLKSGIGSLLRGDVRRFLQGFGEATGFAKHGGISGEFAEGGHDRGALKLGGKATGVVRVVGDECIEEAQMDAKVGGDSREGFTAILWRTGGAFFHRGDFRPGAVGSGGRRGMTHKNRAGYLQCTDKWQDMAEEGALSGGGRSHSGM